MILAGFVECQGRFSLNIWENMSTESDYRTTAAATSTLTPYLSSVSGTFVDNRRCRFCTGDRRNDSYS
jgi:hypothetical protein